VDIFEPNDEKLILEKGLESQFWLLISSKWQYFRKVALNALLSPNDGNRDFLAGKVKGMDDLLGYPEKHIETLKLKIEKSRQ